MAHQGSVGIVNAPVYVIKYPNTWKADKAHSYYLSGTHVFRQKTQNKAQMQSVGGPTHRDATRHIKASAYPGFSSMAFVQQALSGCFLGT